MTSINFSNPTIDAYTKIRLCEPYSSDFGDYGWLHPVHMNECLAYCKKDSLWIILDCYGDVYTFPTLESALQEFECAIGHQMWLDSIEKWRPDFYFAQSLPFFKCVLGYPDASCSAIAFPKSFLPNYSDKQRLHEFLRMLFLDAIEQCGYSTVLLNNRQIGLEHASSSQEEFEQDALNALRDALSIITSGDVPDPLSLCNLGFVPLRPLPTNPSIQDILVTFHADDLKNASKTQFLVPVLTPSRHTRGEEVISMLLADGTVKIVPSGDSISPGIVGLNNKKKKKKVVAKSGRGFGA
jgi:hypothetical protein